MGPFGELGYIHFRCVKHEVEGHYEQRGYASEAKCEVTGCPNHGRAAWYREPKFADLPQPAMVNYASWLANGMAG